MVGYDVQNLLNQFIDNKGARSAPGLETPHINTYQHLQSVLYFLRIFTDCFTEVYEVKHMASSCSTIDEEARKGPSIGNGMTTGGTAEGTLAGYKHIRVTSLQ